MSGAVDNDVVVVIVVVIVVVKSAFVAAARNPADAAFVVDERCFEPLLPVLIAPVIRKVRS